MKVIDVEAVEALAGLAQSHGKELNITINNSKTFGTKISVGDHEYFTDRLDNMSVIAALTHIGRGLALEQKDEETKKEA